MSKILKGSLFIILFSAFSISIFAQVKTRKPKPKKIVQPTTSAIKTPPKKNERPVDEVTPDESVVSNEPQKANQNSKNNARPTAKKPSFEPNYFYEFTQPAFTISQISIEHDEKGKGAISFIKKDFDEPVTDPIIVSFAALERINNALTAMNFLDSTENYQYEKDYSHLGNVKFKVKKDERTRETKFNWTQNENAKIIADEYRKIGQQYIWMFDITLARENQPLEAPKLLDTLDSLIRRNEVSDAEQMIPFLKELSNDERIPLIARNHASRLVGKIEKKTSK
jgi:hypothetical protein